MGKRKRAVKKQPKKIVVRLDKVFDCPFCNHAACVEVKL